MCIGGALRDRLGRLEVLPEDRVSDSNGGFGSELGDCAPVALDDDLVAGRTVDMLVDDDPGVGRSGRGSFNRGIGGFDPLFTQVLHLPEGTNTGHHYLSRAGHLWWCRRQHKAVELPQQHGRGERPGCGHRRIVGDSWTTTTRRSGRTKQPITCGWVPGGDNRC